MIEYSEQRATPRHGTTGTHPVTVMALGCTGRWRRPTKRAAAGMCADADEVRGGSNTRRPMPEDPGLNVHPESRDDMRRLAAGRTLHVRSRNPAIQER